MTADLVATLTGRATRPWGVGGTDLGIPVVLANGDIGYFLGDTFASARAGGRNWRSPVLLRGPATDPAAGIRFTSAAGGRRARQILPNRRDRRELPRIEAPGTEFTVVPSDAVTIGARTYLSVVSVHSWRAQRWMSNFTYLAYSDDSGASWELSPARWDNRPGALDQHWTMERDGGFVYVVSSAFGRAAGDGAILRRVREDRILDPAAYEPWGFEDAAGWRWGAPATPFLPGPFGEMSLRRVGGLWVLAYFDPAAYAIVTRTAERVDGRWSEPRIQVRGGAWGDRDGSYAQIYGGFVHPLSTPDDLHLIVSQWNTRRGKPYHVLHFRGRL
ncbi:DUF4185 domain-containing protein [Rhodococcus rhodnii]|uniref:DUF4185 domain-containing protein n=2 Tax=Rhodococcus rhodnii TaxID=38312 RepID=R7WKT6_9NOCA|nr:DUF4185 domain-containing protein [Rhodococcus rhodnii]EOM75890.1 hypothetical protein Rrhod_2802 [Rhodococcus rhodnii LMG 5362]TXG91056.1 DUF4185 domain-containing protein [Rhodococcus rhodnii]